MSHLNTHWNMQIFISWEKNTKIKSFKIQLPNDGLISFQKIIFILYFLSNLYTFIICYGHFQWDIGIPAKIQTGLFLNTLSPPKKLIPKRFFNNSLCVAYIQRVHKFSPWVYRAVCYRGIIFLDSGWGRRAGRRVGEKNITWL